MTPNAKILPKFKDTLSRFFFFIVLRRIFVVFSIGTFISILVGSNMAGPIEQVDVSSQKIVRDLSCISWRDGDFSSEQKVSLGNGEVYSTTSDPVSLLQAEPVSLGFGKIFEQKLKENKSYGLMVSGEHAAGVGSSIFSIREDATRRGLAVSRCLPTGQEFWFSGINTTSGYEAFLQLANPDNSDIVVSINGFTATGETSLAQFRRIVVPALSVRTVDLTRALPGVDTAAFSVRVSDGRIGAVVQVEAVNGVNALGRSFIQPITSPRETIVLNGVLAKSKAPKIQILATETDAIITIRLATADGVFPLSGAEEILIPQSTVANFDLASAVGDQNATVIVESDQPLVASLTQFSVSRKVTDYEVLTGQEQVRELGVLPISSVTSKTLIDVYAVESANVSLTAYANGDVLWEASEYVGAGSFARLKLPDALGAKAVLRVTSDQPGVFMTAWTYHSTKGGSVTAASTISDVPVTSLAGARINLRVS